MFDIVRLGLLLIVINYFTTRAGRTRFILNVSSSKMINCHGNSLHQYDSRLLRVICLCSTRTLRVVHRLV
jgi:hypothetical protein